MMKRKNHIQLIVTFFCCNLAVLDACTHFQGMKAGRITVDATANLAQGVAEVAKVKAASISDAAKDRVAETTGGQIAAAIKGQDRSTGQTFGENSLRSAESIKADPDSEVAAFRDRDNTQSIL